MDLKRLDYILDQAEGVYRESAQFEVLQSLVVSLTARSQATGEKLLDLEFYVWYYDHLVKLQTSMARRLETRGIPYHLLAWDPDKITLLKIDAILATSLFVEAMEASGKSMEEMLEELARKN